MLSGYVYVDMAGREVGSYVHDLKRQLGKSSRCPLVTPWPGQAWSGQYEFMARVTERLKLVVPLTIGIIFVLYYFTFRTVSETLIVMLGLPLTLVGAVWLLFFLGYNLSIAVWVGIITVIGAAAETSSVMLVYLDQEYKRCRAAGRINGLQDLLGVVHSGAVKGIRPMALIGLVDVIGLLPVMWATGTGDVMKRLAAPQVRRGLLGHAADASGHSGDQRDLALAYGCQASFHTGVRGDAAMRSLMWSAALSRPHKRLFSAPFPKMGKGLREAFQSRMAHGMRTPLNGGHLVRWCID